MKWPKKPRHRLSVTLQLFVVFDISERTPCFLSGIDDSMFHRLYLEEYWMNLSTREERSHICGFVTSPHGFTLPWGTISSSLLYPLWSSLWIHRRDSIMVTGRTRVPNLRAAVSDITQRATRLPRLLTCTGTCGRTRRRCRRRTCAHHYHRARLDFLPLQHLLDVATLTRGCRSPRWGSRPTCWTPSKEDRFT